jgi:hypothetical protein
VTGVVVFLLFNCGGDAVKIAVIDGQGGGIGCYIIDQLRKTLSQDHFGAGLAVLKATWTKGLNMVCTKQTLTAVVAILTSLRPLLV